MPKNNINLQNTQKIRLSPGQALLILIEKYRDELIALLKIHEKPVSINEKINNLESYLEKLYLLYLSGIKSEQDSSEFRKAMADESLQKYIISYDYEGIDNDPTRRYFETHLAATTLKNSLNRLDIEDLRSHYNSLYSLLPEPKKIEVTRAFNDATFSLSGWYIEYISVIKSLNTTPFYKEASELDQEKMHLLIQCSLLGIINVTSQSPISFPLAIYGTGIFYEENRGLKYQPQQHKVRSNHLGIMKSYMSVPFSDIAYSEDESLILRPADNTTFDKTAKWTRSNFSLLTHPFSSSISGTVLCQLRTAKYLLDQSAFKFNNGESFADFMRCFISIMLYQTGGHTFHEYTSVLGLPQVMEAFSTLQNPKTMDKEVLFFRENEAAFSSAIDDTVAYHYTLLKRKNLHIELIGAKSFSNEEKNYAVSNEKLMKKMENKYNFYIYNCIFNYVDQKFEEIEFIAQENNLAFKDILYLKNTFLKRVEQIDFFEAYFKKKFKREGSLNLEINNQSFLNYIYSEAIAPELSNMDKFVYDSMMPSVLRNNYLSKIEDISKLILSYQGINKKSIIARFNADIKLQLSYIKEAINPDMSCVQKKLISLLKKLQLAENQYYNTLFFAKSFRKRHSSLQVKINDAKNMIDGFLSEERELPKNIKHKI